MITCDQIRSPRTRPDPSTLTRSAGRTSSTSAADPIGTFTDQVLENLLDRASDTVVAWGVHSQLHDRGPPPRRPTADKSHPGVVLGTIKAVPNLTRQPHPAMLVEPLWLLRQEPELRRSCLYQACVFAGFSAAWTSLPQLVTGPVYGLTMHTVGALGLLSAATMICSPTMQSGMTAKLTRVYAVRPDSRGQLNAAYMTCAFLGGSAGSWLGTVLNAEFGWFAVGAFVALLAAVALTRHLTVSPARYAGSPGRRARLPRRRPA